MSINTLIESDLSLLYDELFDAKAVYNSKEINVIYDASYEVSGTKEKVIRVQTKDVLTLSSSDIFTIGQTNYKVISFQKSTDEFETIIGLDA